MAQVTRRGLVGTSAGIAAGLGLIGSAQAAEPQMEPAALRGIVKGDQVSLPPLDTQADISGRVPQLDPFARRLGVAVVGRACARDRAGEWRTRQGTHHRRAISGA